MDRTVGGPVTSFSKSLGYNRIVSLLPGVRQHRRRLLVLALAFSLASLVAAATVPPSKAVSARSFLREPLRPDQPLDPNSARYVAELNRLGELPSGRFINTRKWTSPIVVAPHDAPRYNVIADPYKGVARRQRSYSFRRVPIPKGARPSPGGDRWITIHQPATDTLWEFWKFYRDSRGRWHATAGRRYDRYSESTGRMPHDARGTNSPETGSGGAGLALPGGMITLADIERIQAGGRLDHALVFCAPGIKAGAFRFPATANYDGTLRRRYALPYGIAFRLPADYDVETIENPLARELARAVRDYGMYLRDYGGSVAFYGEMGQGSNPWPGIFSSFGTDERAVMDSLPWDAMQAIRPRTDVLR
jgi:hypothetical protein